MAGLRYRGDQGLSDSAAKRARARSVQTVVPLPRASDEQLYLRTLRDASKNRPIKERIISADKGIADRQPLNLLIVMEVLRIQDPAARP